MSLLTVCDTVCLDVWSGDADRKRALALSGLSDLDHPATIAQRSLLERRTHWWPIPADFSITPSYQEWQNLDPHERRRRNSSISSFYSFPPDLIMSIFELVVSDLTQYGASPFQILEVNLFLTAMMHTCFMTRMLAMATPLLWSFVSFEFHQGLRYRKTQWEVLRQHLLRSGNRELHLFVTTTARPDERWADDYDQNIQILRAQLQSHLCRCRSIEIKEVGLQITSSLLPLSGQFPSLQRLVIDRSKSLGVEQVIGKTFVAPDLRVLQVNGMKRLPLIDDGADVGLELDMDAFHGVGTDDPKISFLPNPLSTSRSFGSISTLLITDFTHTSALKALIYASKLPALRNLRLDCSGSTHHEATIPPLTLPFLSLTSLALHPGKSPLLSLATIRAPLLTTLELSAPHDVARPPTYWKYQGFFFSPDVTSLAIISAPSNSTARINRMIDQNDWGLDFIGIPLYPEMTLTEWADTLSAIEFQFTIKVISIRSYVHGISENAIYAHQLVNIMKRRQDVRVVWNLTTRPSSSEAGRHYTRVYNLEVNELVMTSGPVRNRWLWRGDSRPPWTAATSARETWDLEGEEVELM